MWTTRFLVCAVLSFGGLFLGASSARAQEYGYVYGYYYPDSQEFVTFQERPHFQFNISPDRMAVFTHQRLSYGPTAASSRAAPVAALAAGIDVKVPDAKARVWFDGISTTSIGMVRQFQSPPLMSGSSYTYRLKATWLQGGKEVTQERTISVTPKQTTVVDFTR